ncbi:hypothetical protein [Schleiferilactobacillus shenzhenensis]|uniref:Uncharacterized protein n=1 Tax=Schleiferilactobacillus shenzhenensis LY-73 TaxID=1231336 RepID=U4TJJ4_9LACO|nr:hypothetical protein [Schleiferilactobacillus shenzhenensis]ERL65001.1 hypothetical protein L248_3163 [Schleiferilactobacillus shenzhenensis LY-73]
MMKNTKEKLFCLLLLIGLVIDFVVLVQTITKENLVGFLLLNLVIPLLIWSALTVLLATHRYRTEAFLASSTVFTILYHVLTLRLPLGPIIQKVAVLKIIHVQTQATFTSVVMTFVYAFLLMQLLYQGRRMMRLQRDVLM